MRGFGKKNVSLRFGGVKAITDISFDVRKGEILRAIIGPNGARQDVDAERSSTASTRPQEGTIRLAAARSGAAMRPHHAVRQGIARTFQNVALFQRA